MAQANYLFVLFFESLGIKSIGLKYVILVHTYVLTTATV